MATFTDIQQTYINKIQNQELRNLVVDSYAVFSLPESEKNDFVIWMSLIHKDKNAENQLIESLKNEKQIIEEELAKQPKPLTDEQIKEKEFQIMSEEYNELKNSLQLLIKAARTEKELETKEDDKSKIENLLDQLNNV